MTSQAANEIASAENVVLSFLGEAAAPGAHSFSTADFIYAVAAPHWSQNGE
jgi:hypothetical protein